MADFRMQISDDAYKFLHDAGIALQDDGVWVTVRGNDGTAAKIGNTRSAALFDSWKSRLEAGSFEFVIPDE